MSPKLHPWAALYVLQVAIAMFVWNLNNDGGRGIISGSLITLPFLGLAFALWRSQNKFTGRALS